MRGFRYRQGRREGGGRGYNDPGAHEGAHGFQEGRWLQRELERGPIEMTLRNQQVKPEDLIFSTGTTVTISVKTFFFEITLFR